MMSLMKMTRKRMMMMTRCVIPSLTDLIPSHPIPLTNLTDCSSLLLSQSDDDDYTAQGGRVRGPHHNDHHSHHNGGGGGGGGGDRKFECDLCEKKYKQKSHLMVHK